MMRTVEKLVKKGMGLLLCGVLLSGVWSESVYALGDTTKTVSAATTTQRDKIKNSTAAEDPVPGIIKSITPP